MKLNGPATLAVIAQAESELGCSLPHDYREFMRRHNGGDGMLGSEILFLWRVEELKRENDAFRMSEYASDYLLFGSDVGDDAYAFDKRTEPWSVVTMPFLRMEPEYIIRIAPSFAAFLENLGGGWTVDEALEARRCFPPPPE